MTQTLVAVTLAVQLGMGSGVTLKASEVPEWAVWQSTLNILKFQEGKKDLPSLAFLDYFTKQERDMLFREASQLALMQDRNDKRHTAAQAGLESRKATPAEALKAHDDIELIYRQELVDSRERVRVALTPAALSAFEIGFVQTIRNGINLTVPKYQYDSGYFRRPQ